MADAMLNLEMGNLVCRFGSEKVLLDLADEIVLPALFDNTLKRSYDKTSYFFHEVSPVKLRSSKEESVIGIAGRYIKDTTLEREQIFEQGKGLVKDAGSLRSSPSALFLLILNNHRLIYVKETKDAPSKDSFRSTLLNFLRKKHAEHIDRLFQENKDEREEDPTIEKIAKKDLHELIPRPTLDIIPLTSEESIEEFVRKYDVLKTVQISLSDRNGENDNDPFFDQMQKKKDAIGSTKTIIKHANTKGLNKDEAIKEISDATSQGNQAVTLFGLDQDGDTLRGNNEQFQLRKPVETLSPIPKRAATQLYRTFTGIVDEGLIKIPETSQRTIALINSLIDRLFQ